MRADSAGDDAVGAASPLLRRCLLPRRAACSPTPTPLHPKPDTHTFEPIPLNPNIAPVFSSRGVVPSFRDTYTITPETIHPTRKLLEDSHGATGLFLNCTKDRPLWEIIQECPRNSPKVKNCELCPRLFSVGLSLPGALSVSRKSNSSTLDQTPEPLHQIC